MGIAQKDTVGPSVQSLENGTHPIDIMMKRDQLTAIVDETKHANNWPLNDTDSVALVDAVAPYIAQETSPSLAAIQRIVTNYYHDGPMVEAMQSHDTAGEELWSEWRAYMVSLANSKGLYGDLADDLAQEVYLQTVRALGTFRFGSRLKTYFCGIFLNCYRHWARSNKGLENREEALPTIEHDEAQEERLPWLVDEGPSPEEAVLRQVHGGQIATLVHEEISKITKSQDFQILHWYYVERRFVDDEGNEQKWTDDYIGRQLDMPLNTVTSRRLRAVRRLKSHPRLRELFDELTT